jgi:hypothetical protein
VKAALPLLAWLLGLLLGQAIHPHLALLSLALLPLVFLKKQTGWAVAISLSILAFFGGMLYLQSNLPKTNPDSMAYYVGREPVEIEGIVSRVGRLEKASRVNLSQIKINDGGWRGLKGDALVLPHFIRSTNLEIFSLLMAGLRRHRPTFKTKVY